MTHSIYRITNKVNGKHYVGQTKNVRNRWNRHKELQKKANDANYKYRKFIQVIHYALAKYGLENFEFVVVEEVETQEQANDREEHWARELNSYAPSGYNVTKCGEHKALSEETKRKISEAQKGRKVPKHRKQQISKTLTGRTLSEEHKQVISEGMKNSEVENTGQFQKGQKAPAKAFKKGHVPWNTGKSGYKVPAISKAKTGKTKYTTEQILYMKKLKSQGESYRAIAREFGTAHTYVKKLIETHGDN